MEDENDFWKIEFVKKEDLIINLNATDEALNVIKESQANDLLILSTSNQSPEKIQKAAKYSSENLIEMVKYTEEKQASLNSK